MPNFFSNFDLCMRPLLHTSSDPLALTCLQGFLPICSMPSAYCANQWFEPGPALMGATIPEQLHPSHHAPEFPTDAEAWDAEGTMRELNLWGEPLTSETTGLILLPFLDPSQVVFRPVMDTSSFAESLLFLNPFAALVLYFWVKEQHTSLRSCRICFLGKPGGRRSSFSADVANRFLSGI